MKKSAEILRNTQAKTPSNPQKCPSKNTLASGGEGFLFGFYCKSRLAIGVNGWFVVVKKPLNRVSRCRTRAEICNPRFTEVRLLFTR